MGRPLRIYLLRKSLSRRIKPIGLVSTDTIGNDVGFLGDYQTVPFGRRR
jgi:hypothetical protein